MTFQRKTMLAIGALAAGLFAWQRQPADAPAAQAPPPAQPAQDAARSAVRSAVRPQSMPALPDEPPLNVQVDRLLATHDPKDAYRAYWLVADCATFNQNHDRVIFDQEELKHWKRDSLPGFRTMTDDEKRHDAKLCSGMTERERQSRLDYLATAARAGVPGAAINFATEGPFGDPSALQTRPGDPLVQEWKATALAQLTRAAESDADLGAIRYLAGAYAIGSELTERNPLLSYRYFVASSLIDEDLIGPGPMSRTLAEQREGMASTVQNFSPEQRAAELAAARRIADLARAQREAASGKPAAGG
jgi:hypothetical protein